MRAPLQIQLIKVVRWAALFSLAFAIVAMVLLARGDSGERAYMFIATALGVGLGVLLGAALLALLFLGRGGIAADSIKKEDNDYRS